MRDAIKAVVPASVRSGLRWAGHAVRDIVDPIREPRVPQRRNTFVGGGDFVAVGNAFLETLKRHGVTPDMAVLDVGSGQGRMARPMVDFLSSKGKYLGFDIVREGVEWCQAQYADLPNFRFEHADVYNARYNAQGAVKASEFVFPSASDSYDFAFLTSVFTHMFRDDVDHYLGEVARSLKPGGRCLITWFLLNEQSEAALIPPLCFRHTVDDVSKTAIADNPESAIGFSESWVRSLYYRHGLTIEAIEYGRWANPKSQYDLQDVIVARKA